MLLNKVVDNAVNCYGQIMISSEWASSQKPHKDVFNLSLTSVYYLEWVKQYSNGGIANGESINLQALSEYL